MTTKLFSELGLSAEVLKAIDKLGFEKASPIQAAAIPPMLAGRDIVGQSQTGSGKTAAFAIPAIEKVDPQKRAVQVLVLCPTRELAVQVAEEVHKLSLFKRGLHALPIYGGQSYDRQFYGLQQGAQIVIGTPGRVMDHMRRGTLKLDSVRIVVLDEADVMLDMGFREDIEFILQGVPAERQTVFFSATMPGPIQELIRRFAREPENVRIEQQARTVPTVEQVYYEVDRRFKVELLTRLIDLHDYRLGIVFCNTKRMVDDLVDHLEAQGYSADRLHGDMTQAMRDRVMNKFRKSGLEFLVATDVAARGIDVDDVQVVFNYDLPYDPEDYLHRIGRTGRAGRSGRAISFVAGREFFQIQQIERFTRTRIHRARVPTVGEVEEARTLVVVEKIRATLRSGDYRRYDNVVERLLEEGFASTDIVSVLLHQMQGGGETSPAPKAAPPAVRPPVERTVKREPVRRDAGAEPRPDQPAAERPAVGVAQPPPPAAAPEASATPRPAEAPPASGPAEPGTPGAAPAAAVPSQPAETRVATPSASLTPPTVPPAAVRPASVRLVKPPASGARAPTVRVPGKPGMVRPPSSHPRERAAVPRPFPGKPLPPARFAGAGPFRKDRVPVPRLPVAGGPPPGKASTPPRGPEPERALVQEAAKPSRRTPGDQTRLWMNVGEAMGIAEADVRSAIMGETGLPASVVGAVDVRERHVFVDVAAACANGIIAKLNRARIKNHRVKIKVA